jgi:hypothetical protein
MTDDELRGLVRDAIARHLGSAAAGTSTGSGNPSATTVPLWRSHNSFGKFLSLPGDAEIGPCLIEPTVQCNHCGYCKSYGF